MSAMHDRDFFCSSFLSLGPDPAPSAFCLWTVGPGRCDEHTSRFLRGQGVLCTVSLPSSSLPMVSLCGHRHGLLPGHQPGSVWWHVVAL